MNKADQEWDTICSVAIVIGTIALVIFGVCITACQPKKQRIIVEPVPKTETLSHKAGKAVRESGTEFFKGMIGMDSKLKKEADKKAKELEKEKELKQ